MKTIRIHPRTGNFCHIITLSGKEAILYARSCSDLPDNDLEIPKIKGHKLTENFIILL